MRIDPIDESVVAVTRPPAKLNLFLELLRRRDDGFHDIDTVMVPIDWRDQLSLRRTTTDTIDLTVKWLPSKQQVADRLNLKIGSDAARDVLDIPDNADNLVHRALSRFRNTFHSGGGFQCDLGKTIPAGAGMGGASSDAASVLLCAASLCGVPLDDPDLTSIAAELGSDIPFFLGLAPEKSVSAARATGRGELLSKIDLATQLDFVVVYPSVCVSTGKVYANSRVPLNPQNACRLIDALESGDPATLGKELLNRLTEPAKKLAPQIDEILESLWRMGLPTCQLTGSGSACFAIASSSSEATDVAEKAQGVLEPGAIVKATRSTVVPAPVELTKN